jgi:U3 small nucleolar RNA-associated protein 24
MGKQKQTRKFAVMKKIISKKDPRITANQDKQVEKVKKEKKEKEKAEKQIEQTPTALFFQYNTQLGPPYNVLLDTNFINFRLNNVIYYFI